MTSKVKFKSYNDANEVVNELFESIHSRYLGNLETSMRGNDFIFDSVQLMYYKCHKVNFRLSSSCIDSPDWIIRKKKKNATISPKNEDDKCFQYAATVALNYEKNKSHPESVSNIKPFNNKYNWKGINYLSQIEDWKTFEKNNPTIIFCILKKKFQNITQPVKNEYFSS